MENNNEYYHYIAYAGDFSDGKAEINFYGMDGNPYSVNIDKTGKWVNEPIRIEEDEIKSMILY